MPEVESNFLVFCGGSPITLSGNAKLTLIVDGTLSVYGGAAGNGSDGIAANSPGGAGGFAGVYVPRGTTLEVRGAGTLKAYGGHGGDGGSGINVNYGGAGGGGAGAGIGGNGGAGGAGSPGGSASGTAIDNGKPGSAGISAGTIFLYERVTVAAYGGAGGSGGWYANSSPGGAGGYPGAGIGGGGAGAGGGNHGPGGGGFSGGRGEADTVESKNIDGAGGPAVLHGGGGGYFSSYNGTYSIERQPALGGGAAKYLSSVFGGDGAGNGGAAGDGGEVKKSSTAVLTAANGSYKTATKQWGVTPTPIYVQSGYSLDKLRENYRVIDAFDKDGIRTKEVLESKVGAYGKIITPTGLAGVGSGAGFTESATEYVGDYVYFLGRV